MITEREANFAPAIVAVAMDTKKSPQSLFNLGDSGGADIGCNKDAMIAEAFEARLTRTRTPLADARGSETTSASETDR